MTKKSPAAKLPPFTDPVWRAFYTAENEKLKEEHPTWKGSTRVKKIRATWRKQHPVPDAAGAASSSSPIKTKSSPGPSGAKKRSDNDVAPNVEDGDEHEHGHGGSETE